MPVAVITGCTRGIGYAIAQRLSSAYTIVGCSSTPALVEERRRQHPQWDLHICDLSQKEQTQAFASYIRSTYSEIDILVNNAGRFLPGKIATESDEVYEHMLAINLHSAYYLTKGLLPLFMQQRRGLIINIGSIASLSAYPNGSAYSIAKAGLLSFARNLREQLKPYQVGVTTLLLGATLTRSWEGAPYPPERFIPPEAVADLVWTIIQLPPQAVVEEVIMRPLLGDL
ncbi:MAG: SDR family oxidoreductase [Bacteroidia bacterium]|nr:SDR family oxidoreductase [Bacteroidia bacterium]MCX7764214.1 SDR family oxidoreductase [Bacteroidia bacterium]MDW8056890.1 SDR family oxidoreductase [Bacteroidia bacterium]